MTAILLIIVTRIVFGNPIVLPGLPDLPIPDDSVDLLVAVDRSRCAPPVEIERLDGQWISLSFAELVVRAAVRFTDAPVRQGRHETLRDAMYRRAWSGLVDANPRAVRTGDRARLLVDGGKNPDVKGDTSEILGEALGLAVAERALGLSYTAFARVHGRQDYEAFVRGQKVRIETRGRFNGEGRAKAIEALDDKFSSTRDYQRALGILSYPSDRANRERPDVELLDPVGDSQEVPSDEPIRRILRHYLDRNLLWPQFQQVVRRYLRLSAQELHLALHANPNGLLGAVGKTQPELADLSSISGAVFLVGEAFDMSIPPALASVARSEVEAGVAVTGVSTAILRALGSPRTLDLLLEPVRASPAATTDGQGVVAVQLTDGSFFLWAPSADQLRSRLKFRT